MVLRGRNPRFSGKSMMCYLLKHKWYRFERKSWESWNHVFKSLKYRYVYKSFLQHFKTANIAETLIFVVYVHSNLRDFHEKAPRIHTYPMFIDTFPMTFSGFRGKVWETLHKHWRFWPFWSPISHRHRVQNTKLNLRNIYGFGMRFSKKTPKSAAWRSNRIQGFGARGRFLTQNRKVGQKVWKT